MTPRTLARRTASATPLVALAAAALIVLPRAHRRERPSWPSYDPFAYAAQHRAVDNREAAVPAVCYARAEGGANPCWTCHSAGNVANPRVDWELQAQYSFSPAAQQNRWRAVLAPPEADRSLSDAALLAYIREDNYQPLVAALRAQATLGRVLGWIPDLDLERGFDEHGFARDESGWRALRYAPFPGFGPAAGAAGDVFVRLPAAFRRDERGRESLAIYRENFARLERAIADSPDEPAPPSRYVGQASSVAVTRYRFPEGTEFFHSVRYVDPDAPGGFSRRFRELRYLRKVEFIDAWATLRAESDEHEERDEGRPPRYAGDYRVGLRNAFGWQIQGFIEDDRGRLRAQTDQETRACMGCHGGLSVTVDSTFSFARKLRGDAGWAEQRLEAVPLPTIHGHAEPEAVEWLARGTARLFRAHPALGQWFAADGSLDRARLSAVRDYAQLYRAPRAAWLDADRRYLALVRAQRFELGRDLAAFAPPMHERIVEQDTGLLGAGRVFRDALPWLRWPQP